MSKEEESKFNIISKYPKGQKRNVIYTFSFQMNNKPRMYNVEMVWLDFRDKPTWAFMSGKESDWLSQDDKNEFILEISKFQKGGSYRRAHPIAYSDIESLRLDIKKKNTEIWELNQRIEELEEEQCTKLVDKYRKQIDEQTLKSFEDGLTKLMDDTGYILKMKQGLFDNKIMIYDAKKHIYVGMLKNFRNISSLERLDDCDVKRFIKEDNSLRDWLEEHE